MLPYRIPAGRDREPAIDASPPARCVLIAEDEMLLAMMLWEALEDLGFHVLRAGRLPQALQLAAEECVDAAILDINLAGKEVFPVADELIRRGIPFMFTSGYGDNGLPERYRGAAMVQKPYHLPDLLKALHAMLPTSVEP